MPSLPPDPVMYVRVDAIGQAGVARYFEMGGSVRFTSWGDPYVPARSARRKRLR